MTKLHELRWDLGGVASSECDGDNLAILLAGYFEPHVESEDLDESGSWKREAVDKADAVLDAIHAHYAHVIEAERAARKAAEAALAEARKVLSAPLVLDLDFVVYFGVPTTRKDGQYVKIPDEMAPFFRAWVAARDAALALLTPKDQP